MEEATFRSALTTALESALCYRDGLDRKPVAVLLATALWRGSRRAILKAARRVRIDQLGFQPKNASTGGVMMKAHL